MALSSAGTLFRLNTLGVLIAFTISSFPYYSVARERIEFNTDMLDLSDRENIDLSQFSRRGYIMPGAYNMIIRLNNSELPEQQVMFYAPDDNDKESLACLSPSMVEKLGLKEEMVKKLKWWHEGHCLDMKSLDGMEARGDLSSASLYLNIPQAYLEYTSDDWDPPSRWDNGIPGLLLDYSLSAQSSRQQKSGQQTQDVSGNGTVGVNMGAWRLRADWQGRFTHQSGNNTNSSDKKLEWSRYYAYRAIPALRSRLTVGESYLDSNVFDSFRFTGASLRSDDAMLPPNLRGYAPEVVGIAKTNAKVIISQQGRVLYETQVAAGPFRIQDINDSVSGQLDVRVEEKDGSVQEFQMDTASIPYLTRPGSMRYKLAAGRPSDWQHRSQGPIFGTGEFSWGVSNGWSLFGGGIFSGQYNALSLGIGRDLLQFGAISFDMIQARAQLPNEGKLSGGSYRVNYSKSFDEYDSHITFAGYRFSEKNFMNMSEYLDARNYGHRVGGSKEMYTISFNKQFRDLGLSSYLSYTHQTYWDKPTNDRYNLTISRYFDLASLRNLSLSLSAYRNSYNGVKDDGGYLSLSIPWGNSGSLSYNSSVNKKSNSHNLSYYDRIDEHNNYQLSAGIGRSGSSVSAYVNHQADIAQLSANASYQQGQYTAVGMTAQGGATLTAEGGALHRSGSMGGTRLLLDTGGIAGVPVRGYGSTSSSNRFGKVIVTDVNSYYRNTASIDLNNLGDNAEALGSVVQATLTEGAIGFRRFNVIAGEKAMAVIRLADGSTPPFGATVTNSRQQETGIVNDAGNVYLSGINPGESMQVQWNGEQQCAFTLPDPLPENSFNNLLLPCLLANQQGKK
ncbi:outer membrane usher protein [Serratia sp. NPDC078593]|uniref:outer membrane usher protein n=1 Tax=unclassified Serratia (in: enterobacteria) TaxID=2647522 RepID=UPI0037D02CA5